MVHYKPNELISINLNHFFIKNTPITLNYKFQFNNILEHDNYIYLNLAKIVHHKIFYFNMIEKY